MSADDGLAWALRYADAGIRIFPANAQRTPLTLHGFNDASCDPEAIKTWRRKWAHCEFGWAVPADRIVVDLDMKHGKNGFRDFKDRAGCDPRDVLTPSATTPSGGMHLFYKATKRYKNAVAIDGTGIDTRTEGGYVVLPLPGNGREWLRPLIGATLLPAPAWLDSVVKKAPSTRAPLMLAPRAPLAPASSDSWAQRKAQSELERACAKIVAAPCGAQDSTRHAQCFYIGGLIGRGDLGYAEAYAALLEAACAMPVYRDPWCGLEGRVARSIESGMERPLALSETESWIRNFRARMRLMRPPASGARNG
jgi:Bifunctional DNA primase/polymerase, N-terminal